MRKEELFAHQCRLTPDYYFDKCCNKSCKNYAESLDSHCLAVERTECLNSERGISDQEIRVYKKYSSVKQVIRSRKTAFARVYTILILDKYLDHIQTLNKIDISPEIFTDKKFRRLMKSYPFNVKDLNFPPESFPYLLDFGTFENFSMRHCKMCNEFTLGDIIGLDPATISQLAELALLYKRS